MLNFFKNIRRKLNPDSTEFRREIVKKLDGRHIKYATERRDDSDFVIGHDGALIVKDDEFIVFSSSDVVFRSKIDSMTASELLSLEGVILTAPDIEHDGIERTIIAYYTYYRK